MESRISNRSKVVLDSEFRMLLLVIIHANPMAKPEKCFPVRPKGSCQIQSMDGTKCLEMESRISNRSKAVLDLEFRMLLLVVIHADPMAKPEKYFPVRPKGSCL